MPSQISKIIFALIFTFFLTSIILPKAKAAPPADPEIVNFTTEVNGGFLTITGKVLMDVPMSTVYFTLDASGVSAITVGMNDPEFIVTIPLPKAAGTVGAYAIDAAGNDSDDVTADF